MTPIHRPRSSVAAVLLLFALCASAEQTYQLDIQPQPLTSALQAFAQQSGLQVVYYAKIAEGRMAQRVSGAFSIEEALSRLLAGTNLVFESVDEETVAIRSVKRPSSLGDVLQKAGDSNGASASAGGNGARLVEAAETTASPEEVTRAVDRKDAAGSSDEEIVVTGSHIRGVQPSSPVVTITQEQMRLSGHHNLGEVIRALPQNFSGGQNPGVALASGATTANQENRNFSGGSSINLRGLGPGATLVLLNGARLPYDGFRQATDVSTIPVAVIERVEVLLDGASAIYGSDAVGGVANIILKRDYQGAEVSARYGEATDGGDAQTQYTGVAGTQWNNGGVFITGDFSRNTSIATRQRSYLRHLPQPNDIYPALRQQGGLVSVRQQFAPAVEFAADGFYTQRHQDMSVQTNATTRVSENPDSSIWGISPSLQFGWPNKWSTRVRGFFGRDNVDIHQKSYRISTGAQTAETGTRYANEAQELSIGSSGRLFGLYGEDIQAAVGGGYRQNSFDNINTLTGATTLAGKHRSHYAYGEVEVPLISAKHHIPLVNRLTLNGAARYEDYSDFGDVTTPKAGLVWDITADVAVKASWGRSFKTPTLTEQLSVVRASLFPGSVFPGLPAGSTVLLMQGGNPALTPERAEVLTAGIALNPSFVPGLKLEVSGFDIDYTDRVVPPVTSTSQAFSNPAFADFVALAPSAPSQAALISAAQAFDNFTAGAYNPATVYGVVFNQNTNVSREHARGVDLLTSYATELFGGSLTATANATWLQNRRKLTRAAPEVPASGVIYYPTEFGARFGVTWSQGAVMLGAHVNHIDGELNDSVTPNHRISSMTTLDVVADYRWESGIMAGTELSLGVMNAFNRSPPFARSTNQALFVPFDSTNYSAIGRTVNATVTKRFGQ